MKTREELAKEYAITTINELSYESAESRKEAAEDFLAGIDAGYKRAIHLLRSDEAREFGELERSIWEGGCNGMEFADWLESKREK